MWDSSHSPCSNTFHYDTSLSGLEAFLFFSSSSTVPLQFLFIYSLLSLISLLSLSLYFFMQELLIDDGFLFPPLA
jgi:hypothetical protein